MRHFGIPPSKLLGDIRKRLEEAADSGLIEAGRDSSYYLEVLGASPETYGLPAD